MNKRDSLILQIIVLNRMREAVPQVASDKIFGKIEHRDEVFLAIITALEDLEDALEDLNEQESNEEEMDKENIV